jgi:hypothetical protein
MSDLEQTARTSDWDRASYDRGHLQLLELQGLGVVATWAIAIVRGDVAVFIVALIWTAIVLTAVRRELHAADDF